MSLNLTQRYVPGGYQRGAHGRRRAAVSFAAGYGAAAVTLLVAVLLAGTSGTILVIPVALAALCVTHLTVWLGGNISSTSGRPRSPGLRKSLVAQLTPVIILSLAFPLAGSQLRAAQVGSISAAALVLAGSLATPWLSQVVCTPLYAALSAAPADGEPVSLGARWLSRWPFVAASSVLVAGVFGAGIGLSLRWDTTAICALVLLCTLNSLFSQSTVVGNLQRNYLPWAAAWFAYALMLVARPALWFLPPVAGLCTQLVYILSGRPTRVRPVRTRGLVTQFAKGALIGAVLWSDKLFYFLRASSHFRAQFVFLAVLPAIVTYGYYFVRLAPGLDQIVADMRATMESDALSRSAPRLRELADQVEESIVQVICAGAVLCMISVIAVLFIAPSISLLYSVMAVASIIFLVITVLLYMLDYLGRRDQVYAFAGTQLAVEALVILIGPPSPLTYLLLVALSAGVAVVAIRSVLRAWRMPEYSLFWRYATEW